MAHTPDWHILDSTFQERDHGLRVPTRRLSEPDVPEVLICRVDESSEEFNTIASPRVALRIDAPLDRVDPPGYVSGRILRQNRFNLNTGAAFRLTAEPRMPVIDVNCAITGFDPRESRIYWRLQCRHVLCRHQPRGNYQYRGACEVLEDEWQGHSSSAHFRLFQATTDPDVTYDYNSNALGGRVMGGDAILSVAVLPPGCDVPLVDYVHLRIGGTNPQQADVLRFAATALAGRDANVLHMVSAIFMHENNFKQFTEAPQQSTHMTFTQKHHHDAAQPDCRVAFDWPDDPEHFPSASFDWGVGIAQYTKTVGITIGREVAWDWRANISRGINEFLGKMQHQYNAQSHLTWRQWAHRSWKAYNGSGAQAEAYANSLAALSEGLLVSNGAVPNTVNVTALTAEIDGTPVHTQPPPWPPFFPPGDYPRGPSNTASV